MARTVTLSSLRTRALRRADATNLTNFVSDAEVNDYINESIADLYDLMIENMGHEWNLALQTVTTSANANEITLASDFYQLRGVDVVDAGERYPLRPYRFHDRHRFLTYSGDKKSLVYRVYGELSATASTNTMRFNPTPTETVDLEIWYVPHAPVLSSDSHIWDGFNGWEEFVIVDVAAKILTKQQLDPTPHLVRREQLLNRIRAAAANKDAGFPEQIEVFSDEDD